MALLGTAAFVGAFSPMGHADEIGAFIGSKHVGTRYPYNEKNLGGYGKLSLTKHTGLVAGAYVNSLSKVSILAGAYAEVDNTWTGVGITGGLLTGYRTPVPFGAAPYVYAQVGQARATVTALPVIEDHELTGVALGLSIGYTY